MNVELLKKIKRRIVREPSKFRMDEWSCGTAHCIAGWACHLSGFKMISSNLGAFLTDGRPTDIAACKLLRIDEEKGLDLFALDMWPKEFRQPYDHALTRTERAKIAAKRIDHFIATNSQEQV